MGELRAPKPKLRSCGLLKSLSCTVIAAFRRHDSFPNNHRLYVGHLGLGVSPGILQTVKEADVIIAIGTRLSEVTTQDYSIITPEKKLVHIDISQETIGKVYAPDIGVIADANESLIALSDMIVKQKWHRWVKIRRKAYEKASSLVFKAKEKKVLNKEVIAVLQERFPVDAIITNDAGNFAGWLHTFYRFQIRQYLHRPYFRCNGVWHASRDWRKVCMP